MAALDKEMAEERAEALQLELEQAREKLEEATLDLQLMRAEMEAGGNIREYIESIIILENIIYIIPFDLLKRQ